MQIGIDTSVLIGLMDAQDIWHRPALSLQSAVTEAGLEPIYFDCALAEAVSTIARRLHEKRRNGEFPDLLNRLLTDFPEDTITWILPDVPGLYGQVMQLVKSYGGELNFNDGLIALACRDRDIRALASFDQDFEKVPWLKRVAAPEDIQALLYAPDDAESDK